MDEKAMRKVFIAKYEAVIEEANNATYVSDVQDAYATYCEAEGMGKLFEAGFGKPLHEANGGLFHLLNEAWSAWNDANSRICYDPVTGDRMEA